MRKVWLVVEREYLTRVKTKGFVISTVIVPVIGIGFALMMAFLATRQPTQPFRLAVLDKSGQMSGALTASIRSNLNATLPDGQPEFAVTQTPAASGSTDSAEEDLRAQVNSGALDGYLVIPADLSQSIELHMRNTVNLPVIGKLSGAVNQAIVAARLEQRGINIADMDGLLKTTDLKVLKVTKTGESVDRGQTVGVSVAIVMLLYIVLLMYGIMTMRSVLEEKTTRTMESLISVVPPFPLLAGKILGVAAVALTQFVIWMATIALLFSYGALMSVMNAGGSPLSSVHIPISLLIYALIFFTGGYFLYSSFYAAIGAACSNEQDAQQLQWLATLPLVFSVAIFSMVISDPASKASLVLSEIPFFAPILMTLRISVQTPPFWQIALSIGLLYLSVIGVVYVSARVYRIGVLMYGKRPNLPELLRWLRYT
jgi:ABC-2 type transport system permease protein